MKVVSIEIAEAIENEIVKFLEENGEAGSMRFTRFIDLGGKQVELFLYPPQMGASVWCIINVKAVFKTEEGDCVIYSVKIPSMEKGFEDVLVNPERAKLPAMKERVLKFLKDDLLQKARERGRSVAIVGRKERRLLRTFVLRCLVLARAEGMFLARLPYDP